jgi:hypothetical protein
LMNAEIKNGHPITLKHQVLADPDIMIHVDASDTGWGSLRQQ